jgi:tyrosyl-tRNA synthetase
VYQYFINTTDEDVEKFLKILTLLSLDDIEKIVKKHFEKPEERY